MNESTLLSIRWYRTPIDKAQLQAIASRSNLQGAFYTIFHLGVLLFCLVAAVMAQLHHAWFAMFIAAFGYGMVIRFSVNALHELAHGTVFSTPRLNRLIGAVFGFIGMVNLPYFWLSHREHHKYTLHPPYDREVEEPELHHLREFLRHGIISINPKQSLGPLNEQLRLARGEARGEWQEYLFGQASERELTEVRGFARRILGAHVLIAGVSLSLGLWIVPVLLLFGRQLGSLPFQLCNNSQHAGLADRVNDFRLCSRTFLLSPPLRWLYWNMNYHIEHHMYPKVPCYRLPDLHKVIRNDLPEVKRGLWPVWMEIRSAVKRQQSDRNYRLVPTVPCHEGSGTESGSDSGQVEPEAS